jgi:hypothetical protein
MPESYTRRATVLHPKYVILLLDQYGGMTKKFGPGMPLSRHHMCDALALVINGVLQQMIMRCTIIDNDGLPQIRPRVEWSILGYGGSVSSALEGVLAAKPVVTLQDLYDHPAAVERVMDKEINPMTGDEIERMMEVPIWVRPRANGLTTMCAALRRAGELAGEWAARHPKCFPPVVINITIGSPEDGDGDDFRQAADALTQVQTNDGRTLLFTVHLSERKEPQIVCPVSEEEISEEYLGKLFYSVSSVIPTILLHENAPFGEEWLARPGARGLVLNGDVLSIRQMVQLALG